MRVTLFSIVCSFHITSTRLLAQVLLYNNLLMSGMLNSTWRWETEDLLYTCLIDFAGCELCGPIISNTIPNLISAMDYYRRKEQTCLCRHCTDPIVRSLPLLRATALLSCRHATQQEQQVRRDTWWRSLIIAERKQRALILLPSSTNVAFCMKVSLLFLGGGKSVWTGITTRYTLCKHNNSFSYCKKRPIVKQIRCLQIPHYPRITTRMWFFSSIIFCTLTNVPQIQCWNLETTLIGYISSL